MRMKEVVCDHPKFPLGTPKGTLTYVNESWIIMSMYVVSRKCIAYCISSLNCLNLERKLQECMLDLSSCLVCIVN